MASKKSDIIVSILCTTYNHKDYIRQAIDSFLMQKTDFAFEVLINDDASTDGTTQIINDYAKKHPDIIKPVFHEENQYQKGVRGMMARFLLPKAQGKYIALCEGDDYWVDPNKLQKQVDFLEKNRDYALCFHPVKVFHEDNSEKDYIYPSKNNEEFSLERLIKENFIQTNSVLYRRVDYSNFPKNILPLDWFLHIYHARYGKIGFIDKAMSSYRKHAGGLYSATSKNKKSFWINHGLDRIRMFVEASKLFDADKEGRRKDIILHATYRKIIEAMEADNKHGTQTITKVSIKYPELTASFIKYQHDNLNHILDKWNKCLQRIEGFQVEQTSLNEELKRIRQELRSIKKSKTWLIGNFLISPISKARNIVKRR